MEGQALVGRALINLGAALTAAMTSINFTLPPPNTRAVTLALRVLTPINAARRNVR
jgi:hypothetical protein